MIHPYAAVIVVLHFALMIKLNLKLWREHY